MRRAALFAFLIAAALAPGLVAAHGYQLGALKIGHPWARPAPVGRAGAGYLTVTNAGRSPDSLVGASTPAAARVTIHEMRMNGPVMTMRRVTVLTIPAGATVALAPGGYHLMLEGLKRELKVGERVPATLTFARAGQVSVEFVIQDAAPAHSGHM